jgi:hypothetical protein
MYKRGVLLIAMLVLLSSLVFAAESTEKDCIYYFYGDGCDDCPEVNLFLDQLTDKYPDLNIEKNEVYYNTDNLKQLQQFFDAYSVPEDEQGLPIVFMPHSYFLGQESIKGLLEERIKNNDNNECPSLDKKEVIGIVGESSSKSVMDGLSFFLVTGSALLSSVNMGGLALFLVLLLLIYSIKDRDEMLKKGFMFILGIYLAYLLFGMGLFAWFAYSNIGTFIAKVLAILAIIFGLAMIKDFFVSWQVTFKNVKNETKKKLAEIKEFVLLPFTILFMGFILGLFTLTNLSKTFLLVRYLFMEGSTRLIALPILLYSLVLFVLLMSVVLITVFLMKEHHSKKAKVKHPQHDRKAKAWDDHYIKVMNFIVAVVMLILGLIVLFL